MSWSRAVAVSVRIGLTVVRTAITHAQDSTSGGIRERVVDGDDRFEFASLGPGIGLLAIRGSTTNLDVLHTQAITTAQQRMRMGVRLFV